MANNRLSIFFSDLFVVFGFFKDAIQFIRKHRLWKGLFDVKWIAQFIIGTVILLCLQIYWIAQKAFSQPEEGTGFVTAAFHRMGNIVSESYDFLFDGAFKYIVLIIFELIVFHFIRKTIETLTGWQEEVSIAAVKSAVKRMLKITIRNYVFEVIFTILAGFVLGMFGLKFLKPVIVFLIQCFFIGFTLIDNFHEIQKLSISDSEKITRQFPGVAIGLGIGFNIIILIPILGPVLAPILSGVTAARSMHSLTDDNLV